MSDDRKTAQMPSIKTSALEPIDDTVTDEFQLDLDVDEHEATRRLESDQLTPLSRDTGAEAAVPGRNATMPLPAVAASKTAATAVPEEVLAAMRAGSDGASESARALAAASEQMTAEMYPAVEFVAEIDEQGRLQIPRRYEGLLKKGQSVRVRVQRVPEDA